MFFKTFLSNFRRRKLKEESTQSKKIKTDKKKRKKNLSTKEK